MKTTNFRTRIFLLMATLLVVFISSGSYAQRPGGYGKGDGKMPENGTITGKIIDNETRHAVEFANIAVYKLSSPQQGMGKGMGKGKKSQNSEEMKNKPTTQKPELVTGCITAKNGTFKLSKLPMGNYKIKVSFIGYKNKTIEKSVMISPRSNAVSVGVVAIEADVNQISEVTISEEKQAVILGIDKKEFNVSRDMSAQGGSAADVLTKIPSVEVDMDGNVSLRGNEMVTILIDGKPSAITSGDLASFLEQLPASSISSVEVITNPSAKYSPEGMAGIINIVLKKNKLRGTNGSVTASIGTGDKYSGGISISHFTGKVNLFADANFRDDKSLRDGDYYYEYLNNDAISSIVRQTSTGIRGRGMNMLKAGAEYYISDFSSISATGMYSTGGSIHDSDFWTKNYSASDVFLSEDFITNVSDGTRKSMEGTIDYRKTFLKPGRELSATINYSQSNSGNDGVYGDTRLTFSDGKSENTNIQVDYIHPFDNGMKFETGYQTTLRKRDDDFNEELLSEESSEFVDNLESANRFIYNENINGVYGLFSGKLDKLGYQLGLRAEYAYNTSELITNSTVLDTSYFELYPSVHVSYALQDQSTFQLSYSRRVNRPRSRSLNPFEHFSSPLSMRRGNPFLRPEFINSYELAYLFRNKTFTLTSALYYKSMRDNIGHTTDTITRLSSENKVDTILLSSYANYGKGSNYGVELAANIKITKWWQINTSINAFYQKIDGSNIDAELTTEGTAWFAKATSDFTLWKGASAQVSGFYRAPKDIPMGRIQAFTMLNVAFRQKFLDNKASLMLSIRDPFGMMRFEMEKYTDVYNFQFERDMEDLVFRLTFSYRFGKLTDNDMRKRKRNDKNGGSDMMDEMF